MPKKKSPEYRERTKATSLSPRALAVLAVDNIEGAIEELGKATHALDVMPDFAAPNRERCREVYRDLLTLKQTVRLMLERIPRRAASDS